HQAYDDLRKAVFASEFERGSKSLVLHILPQVQLGPGSLRLTAELLREWVALHRTAMVLEQELPRCWVPQRLAQPWFERRGIAWPSVFDPPESGEVRLAVSRRRRRGPKPGTLDRYGAADPRLFNEIERIVTDDKVSVAAAATRLAEEGKVAGLALP